MYSNMVNPKRTPQTQPIPGKAQVKNSAGGYVFRLTQMGMLERFLILGSASGTYYASPQELTLKNFDNILELIKMNGPAAVRLIKDVSRSGRAPKNAPAIFALALAAAYGDADTKKSAYEVLPYVARYSTDLFAFVAEVTQHRGWGRSLRSAIARWYTEKDAESLAYQAIKYQSRNGWSHRDLLRLSHAVPKNSDQNEVFSWIVKGWPGVGSDPHSSSALEQIWAFETAKSATSVAQIVDLIKEYRLPRECIPTQFLTSPDVWDALLDYMPITALIRNLPTMTKVGLLTPLGDATQRAYETLTSRNRIVKGLVHPLSLLVAMKTYGSGRSVKGSAQWNPVRAIEDALEEAFYMSFDSIAPTDKRWMLSLDVSGSMTWSDVAGMPGITPRIASATMAMVTARTETRHLITAFSHSMQRVDINPRMDLNSVINALEKVPMGGTDCSLPMIFATQNNIPVDVFVIYTDSETYRGNIHAVQALREYRDKTGIPAKMAVVGMTSTGFSIADPDDPGCLDVVGFDTATPSILSDFAIN